MWPVPPTPRTSRSSRTLTTNIVRHGMTNVNYINSDAFLTKIVSTGNVPVIQYSVLLGGPQNETAWDLALDPVTTNIFIVGTTTSTNFPTSPLSATNAPFLQSTNYTRSNDVFVASFTPVTYVGTNYVLTNMIVNGRTKPVYVPVVVTNVVLTNLYAVMFGGLLDDFGLGIDVDSLGNAFVCGQTVSGDFPVLDPLQPVLVGHSAGFLAKIQFADALAAVTIDTVPPNLLLVVDGTHQPGAADDQLGFWVGAHALGHTGGEWQPGHAVYLDFLEQRDAHIQPGKPREPHDQLYCQLHHAVSSHDGLDPRRRRGPGQQLV